MKAVAGMDVVTSREIPSDDDDIVISQTIPQEEEEEIPADFIPVIRMLRRKMDPRLSTLVDTQKCFGWLFEDEDGTCEAVDEDGKPCALRSNCESAWNLVKVRRTEGIKSRGSLVSKSPALVQDQRKNKVGSKSGRNKWAGTGKFSRKGYENLGRPVDALITAFMDELGDPPTLPLIFNNTNFLDKYGKLGSLTISQPASYHGVYNDGILVARFWTNAAKHAVVDVVPEMVAPLKSVAHVFGVDDKDQPLFESPEPSTASVQTKAKARPCTHRVIVRSEDAATALAAAYKKKFKWK